MLLSIYVPLKPRSLFQFSVAVYVATRGKGVEAWVDRGGVEIGQRGISSYGRYKFTTLVSYVCRLSMFMDIYKDMCTF